MPTFSKRHYRWLANWMRPVARIPQDRDSYDLAQTVVESLIQELGRDNPSFDSEKFRKALV